MIDALTKHHKKGHTTKILPIKKIGKSFYAESLCNCGVLLRTPAYENCLFAIQGERLFQPDPEEWEEVNK